MPIGTPSTDLLDLEQKAGFGMYFSNYLFDAVRPTLPNTIDIGAIHCRKARYVKMSEIFPFCERLEV